jgi:DNA-binding NarL/FixJ family response regulator
MTKTQAARIRILLLDDHALFREGVARLLSAEPNLEVVAHCATVKEALKNLTGKPIDIVLLDFDLGAEKGSDFLRQAHANGFQGRILILTAGLSASETKELFALGASGIYHKHDSPDLLTKSIQQVMEGKIWMGQRDLDKLLQTESPPAGESPKKKLTERERQVLGDILGGLSNKEIAAKSQVSESAVKAVLQQLFHKTGVRTRSQLVRIALEQYRDQV